MIIHRITYDNQILFYEKLWTQQWKFVAHDMIFAQNFRMPSGWNSQSFKNDKKA